MTNGFSFRRWGVPIGFAALVGVCALTRPGLVDPGRPRPPAASVHARLEPAQEPAPVVVARPAPPPVPQLDARQNEREMDAALFLSTYRNFRNAVATGNPPLIQALKPVLLRQRSTAVKLAQEESDRATSALDRDIAVRTLEALRR